MWAPTDFREPRRHTKSRKIIDLSMTIGVYDSGLGGLTALARILDRFVGDPVYFLADNAHSPFGNAEESELRKIVDEGIKRLRQNADVAIVACNTASTLRLGDGIFPLLPPVSRSNCRDVTETSEKDILLMATEGTLSRLDVNENIKIAHTPELAESIEKTVHANFACGKTELLDFDILIDYISEKLKPFRGVKRVILGCSHYPYVKKQIREVLGDVRFDDGCDALLSSLEGTLAFKPELPSSITFDFTGKDETELYGEVLRELMNTRRTPMNRR